jgi:hypothetical protein
MSNDESLCRSCGCHLAQSDVRQLAVYYRSEQASLVAVQYVCPRCGRSEWQQYDAREWPIGADPSVLFEAAEPLAFEPAAVPSQPPISLDECIDFGLELARMGPEQWQALRESVA